LKKLIKLKNNKLFFAVVLLLITGCSREEQSPEYIAKVNDVYLTEKDLTAISGKEGGQKLFKQEMIRNWVNRELLYQQALKKGITQRAEYKRIMGNSEKELAASMFLQDFFSENMPDIKPEEVKSFFEKNGEIFQINQTAFIINTAEFIDEDKAISFRSAAVETDWNKAISFMVKDRALINQETGKLVYTYDLQPLKFTRIINELDLGEVSLILPGQGESYMIIEMISRLEPGTIPPFEVIKENVEKRYIAWKKSEMLEQFYQELYQVNDIEVKQ
jgi:hypothetical protein